MHFNIRGENIAVTDAIRDFAEEKISKISKYFNQEIRSEVYVNLKIYNDSQKAEVTIPMPNLTLRAEAADQDVYAALDAVVDKLERQIRKYKTRVNKKEKQSIKEYDHFASSFLEEMNDEEDAQEEGITKRKRFELTPMLPDEAILQMEMLGHNFFLFLDGETGKTCVLYKRDENAYGIIESA